MADDTKVQRVNYESDFTLKLKAVDTEGKELDEFPSGDFEIVFTCGGRKYSCSRKGEKYTNCKPNDDGTLTVVFDSHKLLPGVLKMACRMHLPNALYPDGEQTVAGGCIALGVELVACGGDDFATEFDAELVMPWQIDIRQEEGQETAAVMSQKATTDALAVRDAALQEHIEKMRGELMEAYCLMLVGENPVLVGSTVNYTIQAVSTEEADTVDLMRNSAVIGSAESVKLLSVSDTPPLTERGKITYAARAVIGGTMKEGRLVIDVVLPIYLGAGQDVQRVMTPANRLTARTEPKGACSVRVDRAGDWLWIAVPDDMTFAGAEMGGFELPFSLTDDYVKDYKVYRSDSAYKAGTMEIKLL